MAAEAAFAQTVQRKGRAGQDDRRVRPSVAAAGHKSGARPDDTANRTLHLCFYREESDHATATDPRRPVLTSGTGIVRRYQASPLNTDTTPQNSPLLHL